MRTKALFLTAAAGLVSFAVTAQVVSVNVVGFVNKAVPAGWSILNNPLSATANNLIDEVLPVANLAEGTEIYKFDAASQNYTETSLISFSEWSDKTLTLKPGEGFWLNSPVAQTITFVGEVKQGSLTTPVALNFNLIGSQVPQEGRLTADLSFTASEGDTVYQYANPPVEGQVWVSAMVSFSEWAPADPIIKIGEGFFLSRGDNTGVDWTRNFSVAP